MEKKNHEVTHILWAGRFIDWKHPEYAIKLAKKLKDDGIKFNMTMVGDGELRTELEEKIKRYELSDFITITGFKKAEEVRKMMEEANVYLFTSDYKEGWGAVLNEAMNSGCAVVANCAIGSVPSLIINEENGYIYKNGCFDEFESKVRFLIMHKEKQIEFGKAAYATIVNEWNHKLVAKRLVEFCQKIKDGNPSFYEKGPLSEAKAIKPRKMYQYMKRK
jgi:glycosyltransferase involved in cell wall biosynthesis